MTILFERTRLLKTYTYLLKMKSSGFLITVQNKIGRKYNILQTHCGRQVRTTKMVFDILNQPLDMS